MRVAVTVAVFVLGLCTLRPAHACIPAFTRGIVGAPAFEPADGVAITATTNVGRNVVATTDQVEAAPEANSAFRSYVANAKVSGVFQGTPARAVINGKLTRAGETADPGLGIMFDSLDPEKRLLIFKDKSGATVSRRY